MHVKNIFLGSCLALAMIGCAKQDLITLKEKAAMPIQVPAGLKALTMAEIHQSLVAKGYPQDWITAIMKQQKLTRSAEETGTTAAALNHLLAADNPTDARATNIISATMEYNTFIDASSLYSTIAYNSQHFYFYGNQWYHNQAPGGGTYGYFANRNSEIWYRKSLNTTGTNANPNVHLYFSASALYIPNSNASWGHNIWLYVWNGSQWVLIETKDFYTSHSNLFGTSNMLQIQKQLKTSQLYLMVVGAQSNAWNPYGSGWDYRQQNVRFKLL